MKCEFQIRKVTENLRKYGLSLAFTWNWYVSVENYDVNDKFAYYLHNDGTIKYSTINKNGYSGYFKTREQAREAIRKHNKLNPKVKQCQE